VSVDQTWTIPTKELQVGKSLKFDLKTHEGLLLQKAGVPIEANLIAQLDAESIRTLVLHEADPTNAEHSKVMLLAAFDSERVALFQNAIASTTASLSKLADVAHHNDENAIAAVRGSVGALVLEAKREMATMLAVIASQQCSDKSSVAERVLTQSTKLSLLGLAMSVARNDDTKTAYEIALAGLLHDVALIKDPSCFLIGSNSRFESFRKKYRRHPIESADLLNGLPGISRNVLCMMMEVHEQADGTGYPRGMKLEKTLAGSSILNLADAYYSLTEPIQGTPMIPADALAYLCFHTSLGRFCKDSLRLLIDCLSIYPIGCLVTLDDESRAVVIKGNTGSPLQPVVRMLHRGSQEVDLSQSPRSITGPYVKHDPARARRLDKSRMQEVLWRTDR
jgi:HD-GYP domain-containing protein (c-di-GMP phosphodiesterase class II)